jgi:hypothetical protein
MRLMRATAGRLTAKWSRPWTHCGEGEAVGREEHTNRRCLPGPACMQGYSMPHSIMVVVLLKCVGTSNS